MGALIAPLRTVLYATLGALGAVGAECSRAASMQAAVVNAGRIRVQEVPRPAAQAGEVLVKLQFASVNPADWKRASGKPEDPQIGIPRAGQPAIPGMDGAGIIETVGSGVTAFKAGDAVLLWSRHGGTYAQYVTVSVNDIARKPRALPFAQAAGLPHAGLAAYELLVDAAKVHSGQTVLVLGGAGGVGSEAVQIARIEGAHVGATASARNVEYLHELGAQIVIDYGSQHFEELQRNVDVVVNAVDADNAYRGLAVLKRGGYLVSVAGLPGASQCAGRGVVCTLRQPIAGATHKALEQLADWAQSGQLTVNIDRTFELADVLQAWGYSQAGHTRGKVVIRVGQSQVGP